MKKLEKEQIMALVLNDTGAKVSDSDDRNADIWFTRRDTADGFEVFLMERDSIQQTLLFDESLFYYDDEEWLTEISDSIERGESIFVSEYYWLEDIDWWVLADRREVKYEFDLGIEEDIEDYEETIKLLKTLNIDV